MENGAGDEGEGVAALVQVGFFGLTAKKLVCIYGEEITHACHI
jgi:hypothetical protein